VFAMEWNREKFIRIWNFIQPNVPADIVQVKFKNRNQLVTGLLNISQDYQNRFLPPSCSRASRSFPELYTANSSSDQKMSSMKFVLYRILKKTGRA
jgi:hypothetical protein